MADVATVLGHLVPIGHTALGISYDNTTSGLTADEVQSAIDEIVASGYVVGPVSATDNALARFDSTTGKLIQNSNAILDDTGNLLTQGTLGINDASLNITVAAVSIDSLFATESEDASELDALFQRHNSTGTVTPKIAFARSRGTEASPTVLFDNDIVGAIDFYGYDGTDYVVAGRIESAIDESATVGPTVMGSEINLYINSQGGTSLTKVMTLSSSKAAVNYAFDVVGTFHAMGISQFDDQTFFDAVAVTPDRIMYCDSTANGLLTGSTNWSWNGTNSDFTATTFDVHNIRITSATPNLITNNTTNTSIYLTANGTGDVFLGDDQASNYIVNLDQSGKTMGLNLVGSNPDYLFHAKNGPATGTRAYMAFQAKDSSSFAGFRLLGYSATGTGNPHWTWLYKEATFGDKCIWTKDDVHKFSFHPDDDKGLLIAAGAGFTATAPQAKLEVVGDVASTTNVAFFRTVQTNDDPNSVLTQARVATTDATVTTLLTIATASNTTYLVRAFVAARRTGGASGTASDSAGYTFVGTFKNASGTLTQVGTTTAVHTAEDQAAWNATFDVSGTDIRIRVTGAANNDITWHASAWRSFLST